MIKCPICGTHDIIPGTPFCSETGEIIRQDTWATPPIPVQVNADKIPDLFGETQAPVDPPLKFPPPANDDFGFGIQKPPLQPQATVPVPPVVTPVAVAPSPAPPSPAQNVNDRKPCVKCGVLLKPTAKFCSAGSCGAPQTAGIATDSQPIPAMQPPVPPPPVIVRSAKLEILKNDSSAVVGTFDLKAGRNILGASDPATNNFPDIALNKWDDGPISYVSRKHAYLEFENGQVYLTDVGNEEKGSRNGTFVNDVQLAPMVRTLINATSRLRFAQLYARIVLT